MPRYLFLLTALLVGCSGSTSGPNRAPVAMAGPDRLVHIGVESSATLDGSGSYDPDGDTLTYKWTLVAAPENNQAMLFEEEKVSAELETLGTGIFVVKLVVSDGRLFSEPDVVVVRAYGCACTTDADCGDGLYCNGVESCLDCICLPGTTRDCNDGDPCTRDICNEELDRCDNLPVTDPPGTEGPVGDPTCSDGADNDCDGLTDGSDTGCITCTTDQECVDLNNCTQDRCAAGACTNDPIADGSGCDDGQYCTENDTCQQGRCAGTPRDCSAQGGGCTTGVCDDQLDQCVTAPVQDGTACDDGLYCSENDACTAGTCSGADRDCSSVAGDCTDATCNDNTDQCEGVPKTDGSPCEDGWWCTADDQCQGGACTSGAQRDCGASGGSCVDGTCNESTDQCEGTTLPDGTVCDDADNCTTEDKCSGGVCLGTQTTCGHLDGPCSSGFCNPATGQCEALATNEGQICNDGLYCTEGEICSQGSCTGTSRDCSYLTAECANGVCNEGTDQCEAQPIGNGQPCDDGEYCTVGETCQAGSCSGGTPRNCPDSLDGCAQGFCNSATNACDLNPQPDGTPCNDSDPCTFPDECQGGACQTGPPCPLGCDTGGIPPRCYEIDPSNVGHDYLCPANATDLTLPSNVTIDIDTNDGTVAGNPIATARWVYQGSEERDILVLSFTNFTVPQNTTVNISGGYPLALIACADVEINGLINISANRQRGGPGGYDGGDGNANTTWAENGDGYDGGGGGAGFRETSQPYCHTPGGGGGFGRTGGDGGDSDAPSYPPRQGGAGGSENGAATLIPLVGGSGGGGGAGRYNGAFGGGGGGAIQITAGGSVRIGSTGGIRASGAGGWISQNQYFGGGGGGGAGGAILIEGASVEIQGRLTANGGGGGGGRTDYPGWGLYCPAGTPTVGEDGPHEDRRASGGANCTDSSSYPAGDGGRGGAQSDSSTLGENGGNGYIGGGGGGAAGRIRINSFEDSNTDISGSVISPNCSGSNQRCTTGAASLW